MRHLPCFMTGLLILFPAFGVPHGRGPEAQEPNDDMTKDMMKALPSRHCSHGGTFGSIESEAEAIADLWDRIGLPAYRKFYQSLLELNGKKKRVIHASSDRSERRDTHKPRRLLLHNTSAALYNIRGEEESTELSTISSVRGEDATLLMAYPNSGMTWTRRVFERVTKVASESIYKEGEFPDDTGRWHHRDDDDEEDHHHPQIAYHHQTDKTYVSDHGLVNSDDVSIRRQGQTAFIKAFEIERPLNLFRPARVVRLIREPLEHVLSKSHHAHAQYPVLKAGWYLREYIQWHCKISEAQVRRGLNMLSVSYDALLQDPVASFQRIVGFIGSYETPSDALMAAAITLEPPAYKPAYARYHHDPKRPWIDGTKSANWWIPAIATRSLECGFTNSTLAFFFTHMDDLAEEYCPVPGDDDDDDGLDDDNAGQRHHELSRGSVQFYFTAAERAIYSL